MIEMNKIAAHVQVSLANVGTGERRILHGSYEVVELEESTLEIACKPNMIDET